MKEARESPRSNFGGSCIFCRTGTHDDPLLVAEVKCFIGLVVYYHHFSLRKQSTRTDRDYV
jgi:hypothetical protein